MSTEAMPPLPEPEFIGTSRFGSIFRGHTEAQMHLYARTYAADLERRLQEAGRCPCGYPSPCVKTVPVGMCRASGSAPSAAAAAGKE